MKKEECEIGKKVRMIIYSFNGRRNGYRKGIIAGIYSNYAVVKTEKGYNECYFFKDMEEIK